MRPDSCFHCLCLKYFMSFSRILSAAWFCLLLKNVLVIILKTNFLFLTVWDSHPIAESGEYFSKATKLLWRTEIPIYWSKKSRKAYTLETKSENSLEGIVRPPLEISDKYAFREVSARSLASISWVSHSSHLTIINHNASANKWETLVISNHHVKNYGSFVSFRGITRWTVLEVVDFGERFYSVFSVKSGSWSGSIFLIFTGFRGVNISGKVEGLFKATKLCFVGTGFMLHFKVQHFPRVMNSSSKCFSQRTDVRFGYQFRRLTKFTHRRRKSSFFRVKWKLSRVSRELGSSPTLKFAPLSHPYAATPRTCLPL